MRKGVKFIFLLMVTCSLFGCAGSSFHESTGQYFDSSATTAKVKARLVEMLGSKALAVKVRTYKGDVQLSGFVDNNGIKQRAGIIASGTVGVNRVNNDLIVK